MDRHDDDRVARLRRVQRGIGLTLLALVLLGVVATPLREVLPLPAAPDLPTAPDGSAEVARWARGAVGVVIAALLVRGALARRRGRRP